MALQQSLLFLPLILFFIMRITIKLLSEFPLCYYFFTSYYSSTQIFLSKYCAVYLFYIDFISFNISLELIYDFVHCYYSLADCSQLDLWPSQLLHNKIQIPNILANISIASDSYFSISNFRSLSNFIFNCLNNSSLMRNKSSSLCLFSFQCLNQLCQVSR